VLKVEHIVVIGHALCGGVGALLNGAPEDTPDFVGPWVSIAEPALARVPERSPPEVRQQAAEWEAVRVSIRNLRTFPWILEAEEKGELELHGAWFDIRSGALMRLGQDGSFSAWRTPRGAPRGRRGDWRRPSAALHRVRGTLERGRPASTSASRPLRSNRPHA
jgi:hypothetical protein